MAYFSKYKMKSLLKRLSYSPFIVKVFRFLHIRNAVRILYFYIFRPRSRKKKITFHGIDAEFQIKNPVDLRLVETPFQAGMGDERLFLEKILTSLKEGDVVYDIGSSIGIHTVFMAKRVGDEGRVFAFEPEESSNIELRSNIDLNSLSNVEMFKVALGNEFTEGSLSSGGGTGDFSLLSQSKESFGSKVKVVPGDYLIQKEKLLLPNLVKIDVEGYEYYVLQGLESTIKQEKCRMICCEIHPNLLPEDINQEKIISLLESFDFNRHESHPRGESIHTYFYKDE